MGENKRTKTKRTTTQQQTQQQQTQQQQKYNSFSSFAAAHPSWSAMRERIAQGVEHLRKVARDQAEAAKQWMEEQQKKALEMFEKRQQWQAQGGQGWWSRNIR